MSTTRHIGADDKAAIVAHLETAARTYTAESVNVGKRTKAYKELTAKAKQAGEFADIIEASSGDYVVTFSE
jgi:hypothetical protein